MRNWSNCVCDLVVQGKISEYTAMSTKVVRFQNEEPAITYAYLTLVIVNRSTTPERMDLIREEYIRQRQVARDAEAVLFQEAGAAPRTAQGN